MATCLWTSRILIEHEHLPVSVSIRDTKKPEKDVMGRSIIAFFSLHPTLLHAHVTFRVWRSPSNPEHSVGQVNSQVEREQYEYQQHTCS